MRRDIGEPPAGATGIPGKKSAGLPAGIHPVAEHGELLHPLGLRGLGVEDDAGATNMLQDHERPATKLDVTPFQGVEEVGDDPRPAADELGNGRRGLAVVAQLLDGAVDPLVLEKVDGRVQPPAANLVLRWAPPCG